MMQRRYTVSAILAVLFLLVACGSPAGEPQVENQAEFEPAATVASTVQPALTPTDEAVTQTEIAMAVLTEGPTKVL
jgi:ABC-type phosphate/phosphonate transport system substrate-binding protein